MHFPSENIDELKEIAPSLVPLKHLSTYTVPEGYFNELPLKVLKEVERGSGIQSVPEGYFDSLSDKLLKRIQSAESVFLENNPKIGLPYRVPQGYFETLPVVVTDKVSPKVIKMPIRSRVLKLASAAVVAGLIGIAVYLGMDRNVSQDETLLYASNIMKSNSYESVLNELTEEEIVQFLEESGEDVTAALVGQSALDEQLPDPFDYILDDSTLDDFLHDLKIN